MRTKRRPTWVLLALSGCLGTYQGGPGKGDPNAPQIGSSATFLCDPASAALTASPLRRLSKSWVQSAVSEFLSPFSDAQRRAVLTTIQTRFDLIPADRGTLFSQNDSAVAQEHVDALFGLALALGSTIAADASYTQSLLSPCGSGGSLSNDACLTKVVQYYGRKAFRRPLSQAEVDDFKAFYEQATASGVDGITMLVGRLLSHPSFYYRFGTSGDRLSGADGQDAVYRLDRWELLSELTFLFWGAPPTDALYDKVQALDITTDENLPPIVDQILADPRAQIGLVPFYRQWLALDRTQMPGTDGNQSAFATLLAQAGVESLPPEHKEAMIQEVLDLANYYTFTHEGTFDDILNSRYSFARTPELAKIYGVSPWDGSAGNLIELPAGERSGLLTRAAFVASNVEHTRPIIKGKLIRTHILCDTIPDPPASLSITPIVYTPDQTARKATELATAADTCNGCHQTINPLGFASEIYDSLGRFRREELTFKSGSGEVQQHLALDTDVVPTISAGDTSEVKDVFDLAAHISQSGRANACMVRNFFRFTHGRTENETSDGCNLESMRQKLVQASAGGAPSIKQMLRQTVMLDSFRERKIQ